MLQKEEEKKKNSTGGNTAYSQSCTLPTDMLSTVNLPVFIVSGLG